MESHFRIGDIVTDRLGKDWYGTIVELETSKQHGDRAVIRVVAVSGDYIDFSYPVSWIKPIIPKDLEAATMDDTREYLQTVAGGK